MLDEQLLARVLPYRSSELPRCAIRYEEPSGGRIIKIVVITEIHYSASGIYVRNVIERALAGERGISNLAT